MIVITSNKVPYVQLKANPHTNTTHTFRAISVSWYFLRLSLVIGSVKAGQGVLCLYLAADLKRGFSHLLHTYVPEDITFLLTISSYIQLIKLWSVCNTDYLDLNFSMEVLSNSDEIIAINRINLILATSVYWFKC